MHLYDVVTTRREGTGMVTTSNCVVVETMQRSGEMA